MAPGHDYRNRVCLFISFLHFFIAFHLLLFLVVNNFLLIVVSISLSSFSILDTFFLVFFLISIFFFFLVPLVLVFLSLCFLTGVSSIELPSVPCAGSSEDKYSAGLDSDVFGDFVVEGSSLFSFFSE